MTQLQLLRLHIDVSIIREQYGDYKITPGGVLQISSDRDYQRALLGLKFSMPGFFWVGKFGRIFFWVT